MTGSGVHGLTLTGLNLHPVKSTAVRPVSSATVERAGLVGDRRWMVLDGAGAMLTARTEPRLLTLTADVAATEPGLTGLRLRDGEHRELRIAEPDGAERPVRVFDAATVGVDAGDAAAGWLQTALGRDDVRMVFAARPEARRLDPQHAEPGDHTGYADGYPLLLCTESSLQRLNDLILEEALSRGEPVNLQDGGAAPLPMSRFRPNLVIGGTEPFAEDHWTRIRIGEVEFRVVKPCDRCVMTTIDPDSLARGKEPLRTLARHRKVGSKVLFGQNLIPDGAGRLRIGQPIEVLA